MFGSNEITLKQAINKLLKAYRLDHKLNETRLINSWEKVVGKLISKHTTNLNIRNQKLFVSLDSAALKNELSFSKEKIVDMLNKEAGSKIINDIVFT